MKNFFLILCLVFSMPVFGVQSEYMNMSWWERFGDENLTSNLLILYDKNYDLKNAELKIKENEQVVKMQFAQELPGVVLSGNLSRDLQGPRQQFGNMQIPKYSQYNYNIPLTTGYEVDIWGKNRLLTKSKKQQLEIIKQAERATCISLSSDFAADYFNLIKADKLIEIQGELVKLQEDILTKTTNKYKSGLCPVMDVLVQEKLLTTLREEYNLHVQAQEVLVNTLRVYLADGSDGINRGDYDDIVLLNGVPSEFPTGIVENRPDFKQEEANIKRIGFDVKAAKREFLPTFTIYGQVGLNAYHWGSLFNKPSQFFNAGILPTWDLFSGGRKRAFLKIKKYQYEQALNDLQKTFLTGVCEINSGLAEYKTVKKNYEESLKRLETEGKIYKLAKNKNEIGAASVLDTLYAREMYLMSQKDEISNKINLIITTIGLYKAAGGVDLFRIQNL